MLFHVRMEVAIPHDLDPEERAGLVASEKALALELQASGVWPELWRVVGEYANISIFDVSSNDELHRVLASLPLFPFMAVHVTPLATHPSKLGS